MSLEPVNGNRGRVVRLRTSRETAARREQMERAVELLIEALDALDVTVEDVEDDDPGEEVGDAEPSLGWTHREAARGVPFQGSAEGVDREDEHDGREPDEDREGDPAELGIADLDGLAWVERRYD